ncbi:hypothetical protein NAP1_08727 [Erythrobacter sp. NAP1]|uniref:SH3 domain-containing protein n=1 Tax=Erythrobacter sp. NAP1 TaxID=237727 RepID=UPI0000685230|nr:SH3 domain-containing protein [Erythrobacter sp. NAP1]EAQ27664.1 hypothetical protein NAP1_08727 [Erythrobacter sp. NAP1]
MKNAVSGLAVAAVMTAFAMPAPAMADDEELQLVTCEESLGTIAVVDGDTQGWADFSLGSPRELINTLAVESGCFTPHSAASGVPADFLMNVVAGTTEEVDQSIELAKTAAVEGLVRSGAAASVMSRVPGAGAMLGMFGGLGGRSQRLAAGIKLLSPATGQTIVTGSGEVRRTSLSFRRNSTWGTRADEIGYRSSGKGKKLVEAFVIAFNQVVAQDATITSIPKMSAAAAEEPTVATVAVATSMMAMPMDDAEVVRGLMEGTTLSPTGKREGLFIEVEDNFGTKGWVSVEALN